MLSVPARLIAIAVLIGAAMPLAFAPFHWWWLAPIGYAALFLLWQRATPRLAFLTGLGFGFAQFLFGIYWIVISVHEIGGAPFWLAAFLMLGLVSVMALYIGAVGYLAVRWFARGSSLKLLGSWPAIFMLAEWLRGWLFTGFGWMSPGYAQTESWLVGLAPVLGLLGVSWAVFVIAGALAMTLAGGRRERFIAGSVVLAVFASGWLTQRVAWTESSDDTISVALVQGAVPQELKWLPEQLPLTMNLYRELTVDALGSDLIIWPEAAIPQYYHNLGDYLGDIEAMATRSGSELVLGMLRYEFETSSYQNAVFALSQPDYVYLKRHLVPYGEYFPVPGFVRDWLRSMELPNSDTVPAAEQQPTLALLGERIAITICYEDVFGAEQLHSFPEATLLINVSNDAWFGDSIAPHQHLQIAQMRSAEVRRWQARATNTGITAVIDPHGRIDARLVPFEPGVLPATVTGRTGSTPYIVWGNWAVVMLALAVLGGERILVRRRRDLHRRASR